MLAAAQVAAATLLMFIAGPARATAHGVMDELEIRVWTADDYELPVLEKEVVRLIQTNPGSSQAHYLLTHLMARQFAKDPGDLYLLKQASDLAQQAIDLEPKQPFGYVAMADILDLMGNSNRGLALLTEAENNGLDPSWRFYFTRARLAADDSQTDKVFALFETALGFQDSLQSLIVPYVIAMLQSTMQGEQLVQQLNDWNRRFPAPLFELTTAITESELGHSRKAHEIYASMIKRHSENKEAKVNDAVILYRDLKEPAKAEALLDEVLTQHQTEMTEGVESMVRAHLGAAYVQQKKFKEAEQSFAAALGKDATNLSVVDFITKTYRNAKAHDQLAKLIRRLNATLPGTGVLHALLGETLSESLAKHDDALKAFSDAIVLDPSRSDYYNGMGLAYYRKKSYPDALKLFVAATEVDPNDATAHYNEACVLSLMGRGEEAVASLSEAVTIDPRLMQNAKSDEDFRAIRGNLRFRELVQTPGGSKLDGGIGH